MALTQEAVLEALRAVQEPEQQRDLVTLNMAQDIAIEGNAVSLRVVVATPAYPHRGRVEEAVTAALQAAGASEVAINWDSQAPQDGQAPPGAHGHEQSGPEMVGVKHVIAVASNKGGVGKSTVATNLAVALARDGASVGLIDADITGPNLPTMFGLPAGFQQDSEQGLHAVERFGVKVISLGFLLPPNSPVVWRGPMIGSGVRQLLHDVEWGELDYLFVDLPPGTSDASMTLAQEAPLAGAIIVSTPQPVSLEDAGKAVTMFEKLNVPVFGIVENMSYFVTPDTGARVEIFGHGGAQEAADELAIDFLGEIPLATEIRAGGDEGRPLVEFDPDGAVSEAFIAIAQKVARKLAS